MDRSIKICLKSKECTAYLHEEKGYELVIDKNEKIIAYSRIFNAGDYFENASMGRIVVQKDEREYGYGHDLVKVSIEAIREHFKQSTIKLLVNF